MKGVGSGNKKTFILSRRAAPSRRTHRVRASLPAPMNDLPEPAEAARPSAAEATPVMAQYLEIKRQHPDCVVFYRMGDFYEMFFEDAQRAAAALDIALTKRGRHEGGDIPMCGVPVHAAEAYLS